MHAPSLTAAEEELLERVGELAERAVEAVGERRVRLEAPREPLRAGGHALRGLVGDERAEVLGAARGDERRALDLVCRVYVCVCHYVSVSVGYLC